MKIVVLVIAHDASHYTEMQELWRGWMHTHPDVKCYFLKTPGDNNSTDTIYTSKISSDSLIPGCLVKTVDALHILFERDEPFDYLVRTNLSSLWDLNGLYTFLSSSGGIDVASVTNLTQFPFFLSGAGMVMSRKWWTYVYDHSSQLDYSLPDDVAISEMLKPFNLFSTILPRWDADKDVSSGIPGIFHMRCKGTDDPSQTVRVMRELIPVIYPCVHKYHESIHIPSDIFEHLPTIMKYARQCERVLECTSALSSSVVWAFLYGLSQNGRHTRELLSNYSRANTRDIQEAARGAMSARVGWRVSFTPSSLDITIEEHVDLTFIDTWHVYAQLARELSKFAPVTRKYILLHDTTVDESLGETIRNGWNAEEQAAKTGFPVDEIRRGVWPAITDFLSTHPDWSVAERFVECNGLTVLKRG